MLQTYQLHRFPSNNAYCISLYLQEWVSVVPNVKVGVNGHTFTQEEMALGAYNVFLFLCPLHDPYKTPAAESMQMFKTAFPGGFVWEVLEAYSGELDQPCIIIIHGAVIYSKMNSKIYDDSCEHRKAANLDDFVLNSNRPSKSLIQLEALGGVDREVRRHRTNWGTYRIVWHGCG